MRPSRATISAKIAKTILRVIRPRRAGSPRPYTVSIRPGEPSFLRNAAMCTSRTLVGPYQCASQATFQDLLPAHHASRIGREAFENVEFLGRERHLLAQDRYLAGPQVHGQRPVPDQLTSWPHPAEHGPDPGLQLGEAERLDQVVVRARIQRVDPVRLLAVRGNDDDRDTGSLPEPPADLHAVDVGQLEVEQHDVRITAGQRLRTGHHVVDPVAAPGQAADQLGGDARVVFHHQHAGRRLVSGHNGPGRPTGCSHGTTVSEPGYLVRR